MDLAYLRQHPHHLPTFLTHQRIRETPVAGGSICQASRLTLDDGNSVFAKTWPAARPAAGPPGQPTGEAPGGPPAGFFAAEAAGLNWLREAGAVPIPGVIAALPDMLALEWIDGGTPSARAAEDLGRGLATLHRSGADSFGAAWPGYIGALPMPNDPSGGPWPEWFAAARLEPFLRISADRGALSASDVAAVTEVLRDIDRYAGPAAGEPPARIHGDLWPGNLLWAASGRVYLIDPAAHGGHRETDLATLALFGGAPQLDRILAGYREVWPLAPDWERRVPLHQLHLLLVHTAMFGSAYRDAVLSAIRATVRQ
ncbi:MAG TPA: fructosamine kinase family protein [Rugosimonospora sp.]